MRIGLLGFEFESPNKGCEALSYSFIAILYDILQGENVTIEYISSCSLGKLPELFPNFSYIRTPNRLKDIKFAVLRAMYRCDIIFDVTMGDSFSDIYSEQQCLALMRYKTIAEFLCKRYILLPQTYGPYKNGLVKEKAKKIIEKAYKVYSRDKQSEQYMDELGIHRNINSSIDMAFALPYDKLKYPIGNNKFNLGINVSGLLWKGGFQRENQFNLTLNYQEYIYNLLNYYSELSTVNIHLIPHVIDLRDNFHDDDYQLLKNLHERFPKTILAPSFDNPIDAKSYISNMDCFIGARMHSTIAAFSSGVATVPVSYSRKFEGLFDTFQYHFLIHGTEDDTMKCYEKTIQYILNYKEIKQNVEQNLKEILKNCKAFKQDLETVFDEIKR